MTEKAMLVAMRIKELREGKGLTQRALADKAQIDPAALSRIEKGASSPTLNTLLKIIGALGVDPALLFQECPQETEDIVQLYTLLPADERRRAREYIESMVELFLRRLYAERYGFTLEDLLGDNLNASSLLEVRVREEVERLGLNLEDDT